MQLESFDEPYLQRLQAADPRTEQHFIKYFSSLLQIKLRSRLPSREAIEDVRQETFARFFVALRTSKIQQPDRVGSFVNSICNNVLREYYRRGNRDTPLADDDQQDFPAPGIHLLDAMTARESDQKVREILEQLPERDRRLLREVFLEERDKDEVCRDFAVPRDYLRVLLHRAKEKFKLLYLENMDGEPPGLAEAGRA